MSRKPIADILGQVYEQFLGKVTRLTAYGHGQELGTATVFLRDVKARHSGISDCRL